MGLALDRRVPRPPRRNADAQRGVPRRSLRHPAGRDEGSGNRARRHGRRDRRHATAAPGGPCRRRHGVLLHMVDVAQRPHRHPRSIASRHSRGSPRAVQRGEGPSRHHARIHPPGGTVQRRDLRADGRHERGCEPSAELEPAGGASAELGTRAAPAQRWRRRRGQRRTCARPDPARHVPSAAQPAQRFRARHPARLGQADGPAPGREAGDAARSGRSQGDGRHRADGAWHPAHTRQLDQLHAAGDVLESVEAVRGAGHRSNSDGARQDAVGHALRHRHRRRLEHRHREHGHGSDGCELGEARRGVAGSSCHRRCIGRRRPPRHDRQLQLRDHAHSAHHRGPVAVAARGSRALSHRIAGCALRVEGPRRSRCRQCGRHRGVRSHRHRAGRSVHQVRSSGWRRARLRRGGRHLTRARQRGAVRRRR